MELINRSLDKKEIAVCQQRYGDYLKLTVDLEKERLVAGSELHADGEKILLEDGSKQDNIWGGGVDLKERLIDTTAVINLRPRLENDSLEILDPKKRVKFLKIVKKIFKSLWD